MAQYTGIINNNATGGLVLYPNPTSENLFLTLPVQTKNQRFMVEIFGMNGVRMMQEKFNPENPKEVKCLNVGSLLPGTYLLKLTQGKTTFTQIFNKN
jgi:hypothetical protein